MTLGSGILSDKYTWLQSSSATFPIRLSSVSGLVSPLHSINSRSFDTSSQELCLCCERRRADGQRSHLWVSAGALDVCLSALIARESVCCSVLLGRQQNAGDIEGCIQ